MVRCAPPYSAPRSAFGAASDEDQAAYADLDLTQMYTVHCGYTIGKHKAGDVLITTSVRRETP